MVKFLENIFGPNWRNTIWGGITAVLAYIALQPESVAFLPDNIEGYVIGIVKLFAAASGIVFASQTKNKRVGGTGQAPSYYDKDGTEIRYAEPVDEKEEEKVEEKPVTKQQIKTLVKKLQ